MELTKGMAVVTAKLLGDTGGMLIADKHLACRRTEAAGELLGFVPGHGGDVWWIRHEDDAVGAYSVKEFYPAESPADDPA